MVGSDKLYYSAIETKEQKSIRIKKFYDFCSEHTSFKEVTITWIQTIDDLTTIYPHIYVTNGLHFSGWSGKTNLYAATFIVPSVN